MYGQFNLFVDVCLIDISRLVPSLLCSCKFLYYNIPSKLVSHVDTLRLRLRPIGQLMYVIRLRLDNGMSAQQPRLVQDNDDVDDNAGAEAKAFVAGRYTRFRRNLPRHLQG